MIPDWCRMATITLAVIMACANVAVGKDKKDTLVTNLVYGYESSVDSTIEGVCSFSYLKYQLTTNKRNLLMLAIPRLHNIAHGNKSTFFGESFFRLTFHEKGEDEAKTIARTSTIPRRRKLFPNLHGYLTPHIYNPTIINDHILSPFHKLNHRYYKYKVRHLSDSLAQIDFTPRTHNTQTVRGHAVVDTRTGRVINCFLKGNYDLTAFELNIQMGETGRESLLPNHCELTARLNLLGNHVQIHYDATYFLPDLPEDTALNDVNIEREFIESHRPDSLNSTESKIISDYDSTNIARLNEPRKIRKQNLAKDVLWNIAGENLLHRFKGHFGTDDRGLYRISPLLNPLYLSYSKHKGITYRLKANGSYRLSTNSDISLSSKLGYSFKLQQFFIEIPLKYTYDIKHNGYFHLSYKDGNHITSSTVIDKLKEERSDTIEWDKLNLKYFKHQQFEFITHYDFCPQFGAEVGVKKNKWKALNNKDISITGKPQVYESTSFLSELTIRPLGWKGPVCTIDYERTINGMSKGYMNYERWEFDLSYLEKMPCMKSLSLRLGGGFYSTHTTDIYFLDYTNFRENNIPGGWNDEWSGEFELLHRNYYNASKYYIRMNATYESPLLLVSWIPVLGYGIEKERLYLSTLRANKISNYVELGYGFTNQLFSMGCFMALKNGRYDGIGFKFGFELFDGW